MTMGKWARLSLMGVTLLAGCKGFWDAPSSSSGSGSTTASSGVFYVANLEAGEIVGYYINSGVVTALSGSPYAVPAAPVALAVSPSNSFLYASTAAGIYVYSVASDGALTLANSGSPISADPAQSLQVDATNSWLVEAVSGSANVYAIPLNPSTGGAASNTEKIAVLPNTAIQQVAISSDNLHVFVAMGAGGTAVIPFTSGNEDPFGAVGNIPVLNSAGAALSVAVDPDDRLFYVGETAATSGSNSGGLRVFDLSTLKEIAGSPFASQGLAPYSILPISTGDYVYVANRQVSGSSTGVIAGFSIASTNSVYSLTTLGSTFAAGTNPQSMVEDNTDTFVLVTDFGGNPDLKGYTFDTTNAGYLDAVISSATGTDPVEANAIAAQH
ncbi:MAG TPA: beta-propeller fold lactonase family protein [Terracidiphilus sp.]|nr:beta-propeller fold lactonase family protein [Terracidiphilus sp.]